MKTCNMKVAYIAHPIGGDVINNLARLQEIVRNINLTESDVVPFVPYYSDCMALNDANPAERIRGMCNNDYLLRSGIVTELRLYGNTISKGMQIEIKTAHELGIPVKPYTFETDAKYTKPMYRPVPKLTPQQIKEIEEDDPYIKGEPSSYAGVYFIAIVAFIGLVYFLYEFFI